MNRIDPGESGAAQEWSGLMKGSEINRIIKDMEQLIRERKLWINIKKHAEKLLMLNEGQTAAMHFHWSNKKDIINRGN